MTWIPHIIKMKRFIYQSNKSIKLQIYCGDFIISMTWTPRIIKMKSFIYHGNQSMKLRKEFEMVLFGGAVGDGPARPEFPRLWANSNGSNQ